MKKFQISAIAFALTGIAASSAMAQTTPAQAWAGASVDVKAGYASFIPKIGNGTVVNSSAFNNPSPAVTIPAGTTYATTTASASTLNTATAAVEAGYNFALDQDKLLGLGLTYYTGATGGASGTLNPTGALTGAAFPAVNITYQVKNLWAISLTPGYAIDKDRLVYAKVGYTGVTIGASGSSTSALMPYGGSTVPYQTVTLSGYNLGLGYKQIITGSLYWLAEANYASFSNKTATIGLTNSIAGASSGTMSFGGSGYNFLAGVGYRF
jgi:outer membrane immunogenic protein